MANITGEKMLYNLQNVIERKPITADIFLNDYCNNKCPYCTYGRYVQSHHEYMRYTDFKKYVNILLQMGVKGVILTGGGEPTINKDFDRIAAYLEREQIPYGINTNFNVLKLIKPKYLKVSLDGWSEDSYEEHRGVRQYEKTRENIITYAEWKKENSPSTSLGVQSVVTSKDALYSFYEANKDLDVDYFNMRPVESTCGSYYLGKSKREIADLISAIQKLRDKDRRVILNYKWFDLETKFEKCHANFAQIAINQRGEVMYCCHKPYEIIGHITDCDIKRKREIALTNLSMCDVPCRLTAPNKFIKKIDCGAVDSEFI